MSGHMLSVAAFALVMAASGLAGQGIPGLGDGDGSGVPGLGDSTPESCSVTSTDPGNRESCNSSGHNGGDARPGAVHGHGHYQDYRDQPEYRKFQAEHAGHGTPGTREQPRSIGTGAQPKSSDSLVHRPGSAGS